MFNNLYNYQCIIKLKYNELLNMNKNTKLVGYARVSTIDQNLDLQIHSLKKEGCIKIFTDTISGSKKERIGLSKLMDYLREGDTLIVWRLDRLGRSLKDLIEIISELEKRNIYFKSIQDSIDTSTPTGKFFFHVTGAFAELERNLIRERTIAGLKAARSRGKLGGRPKKIPKSKLELAKKLYDEKEKTVQEICDDLGFSRGSFYNYLKK